MIYGGCIHRAIMGDFGVERPGRDDIYLYGAAISYVSLRLPCD